MKRLISTLSIACLAATAVQAQSQVGTFSITPKIGTNLSNWSSNDLYTDFDNSAASELKSKNKAGLVVGADVQYQASDVIAISAGVEYSRQGYRYDDYETKMSSTSEYDLYEGNSDTHHNIDYLNVPLMLKGYVARGLAIGAGVQAGFVVGNKYKWETSEFKEFPSGNREYSTTTEKHEGEWTSKSLNAFDLSIPLQVSYEYMNVVVAATYNIGVTSATKDPLPKSKNKVIKFTVGYKFDL